jgi:hypothetical protein
LDDERLAGFGFDEEDLPDDRDLAVPDFEDLDELLLLFGAARCLV